MNKNSSSDLLHFMGCPTGPKYFLVEIDQCCPAVYDIIEQISILLKEIYYQNYYLNSTLIYDQII